MSMATTISNLKEPAAWLEINLSCQQLGHNVELTILFTNTHETSQIIAFSNQARKAELLGLLVLNEAGERVTPSHNLIIRLTNATLENHTLAPGATFSYLLIGELKGTDLIFPGAIFALNPEENYQLQFRYAGKQSNAISLTAPSERYAGHSG